MNYKLVKFDSWLGWSAGFKRLKNLGYEVDGKLYPTSDYRDYLYQVKGYRYLLVNQEDKTAMTYGGSTKNIEVVDIKEIK